MIPKILTPQDDDFPEVSLALTSPNGLLAIGGDLNIKRLLSAYHKGIFPWFTEEQPILWWSPDPRGVLFLEELKISRSLGKLLKKADYTVTFDQDFQKVIEACALPRAKQDGTWITREMINAYCDLHQNGYAHSVEVWRDSELIGGLYGVDCGKVFTGESMFSTQSNAAKIAFAALARYLKEKSYVLLDCQITTPFLQQFGVKDISRKEFLEFLADTK